MGLLQKKSERHTKSQKYFVRPIYKHMPGRSYVDILRQFRKFNNERVFVLNKPYFKKFNLYPDIVVFKREKPWVLIELKEMRLFNDRSANKEREKILRLRRLIKDTQAKYPRQGYLIWVARKGKGKIFYGPKGEGARFLFTIPIILNMENEKLEKWREIFRRFSKYDCSLP